MALKVLHDYLCKNSVCERVWERDKPIPKMARVRIFLERAGNMIHWRASFSCLLRKCSYPQIQLQQGISPVLSSYGMV